MPSRRLEEAQKLPRGSLVALENTIVRHVFLIKGERFTLNDIYSRDGQKVEGNYMGGVITNLHLPRDWWILEVEPTGANRRVHFAIGCHPKQAALLTASLLKRLEELVRRPGAVAVGECGLDYSAR